MRDAGKSDSFNRRLVGRQCGIAGEVHRDHTGNRKINAGRYACWQSPADRQYVVGLRIGQHDFRRPKIGRIEVRDAYSNSDGYSRSVLSKRGRIIERPVIY